MSKSKMDAYTSEYCMSTGDNAASRKEINQAIVSKATANEGEYVKALKEGLDSIGKKEK
jgi:hypothetical protein